MVLTLTSVFNYVAEIALEDFCLSTKQRQKAKVKKVITSHTPKTFPSIIGYLVTITAKRPNILQAACPRHHSRYHFSSEKTIVISQECHMTEKVDFFSIYHFVAIEYLSMSDVNSMVYTMKNKSVFQKRLIHSSVS